MRLQQLAEAVANITRFLEFDPSYFIVAGEQLKIVNVALGFLKCLASYGRKLFAAFDMLHAMLHGGADVQPIPVRQST